MRHEFCTITQADDGRWDVKCDGTIIRIVGSLEFAETLRNDINEAFRRFSDRSRDAIEMDARKRAVIK